ncbi:FAD binding domain-containing protein [Hypoxylon sp. NC0597]|nr:FAD binding domain-containing protein [Hypoxylon sp. NC0597]
MAQNDQTPWSEEQVDLAIIRDVLMMNFTLSGGALDAKPGPLGVGRADALNARTQQYLEAVGILDELLPLGIKCNSDFKSRQSHWWTSLQHCFRPNFLMIGQPVVEQVLSNHLEVPVCYGEKVISVSETEYGVTVDTDRGGKVRSKYAIAADGARSTVRPVLDISFTGTKPEIVWTVLDTFIDADFPLCSEIITFHLNGRSRVSWIPRERGMARFYVLLDGEITQRRAEDSIREHMAPHRVDFVRTEWFSTFDVKERIASTIVSKQGTGRIILAGDATHVHSVNGGQGLNTGIADAFALTWLIAAAVNNAVLSPSAATKFRSYDTERRTVAQEVIDVAATAHTAKQYVSTIEKNAGYIIGMGVSYDGLGSELISERYPDIWITRIGDDEAIRLYSTISYGKYLVLFLGEQDPQTLFRNISTYFILCPDSVGRNEVKGHSNGTSGRIDTFSSDVVTAEDNFVVIVRLDMYIGYVGEGDGWKGKGYLEQLYAT